MRCLVTGGAGFVGSHLCEKLLDLGHSVVALDNCVTGAWDRVAHLRSRAGFSIADGDVREPFDFEVERIYHLACPASPPHYARDPIATMLTNVEGTYNALRLAEQRGARLLQASTSEVYGDPEVSPQPESYRGNVSTVGPRACYDEGKRAAETLCFDFARLKRAEVRVVRIFNTYGPRMAPDDGRVVSNFICQALSGEPITLYGDGQQSRSFCYVDDLVRGIVAMMEQDASIGPVNLGNDSEFTVRELAEKVLALVPDSPSQMVYRDLPTDDPKQRRPDLQQAKALLGYAPTVPLEEGLVATLAYFRECLAAR